MTPLALAAASFGGWTVLSVAAGVAIARCRHRAAARAAPAPSTPLFAATTPEPAQRPAPVLRVIVR